jgi:hypothetical protein
MPVEPQASDRGRRSRHVVLGIILFGIKPIKCNALVGTDPGCLVRHRMGIDPVILHVDFSAGNKEGPRL